MKHRGVFAEALGLASGAQQAGEELHSPAGSNCTNGAAPLPNDSSTTCFVQVPRITELSTFLYHNQQACVISVNISRR